MTAAIAIRVSEGVVLAADSQTSLVTHGHRGPELTKGYATGRKLLVLRERPGLAALCWGAGSIGGVTLPLLVEATAETLSPTDDAQAAADALARGCNAQLAAPELPDHNPSPGFGILVVGYGPEALTPEAWLLRAEGGRLRPSQRLDERLFWAGDGCEPILRLVLGHGGEAERALRDLQADAGERRRLVAAIEDRCLARLVHPEMPLAEAEALADHLLACCLAWARFAPGAASVGGRIERLTLERGSARLADRTPDQVPDTTS